MMLSSQNKNTPLPSGHDGNISDSIRDISSSVGSAKMSDSMRDISDSVIKASRTSRLLSSISSTSSLSQLNLSNMQLHGREEELKLLKSRLRSTFITKVEDSDDENAESRQSLLLVGGVSG